MRERTTFVKPKNSIVGNIYFDLGNVLAQTRDVQAALESYEAAKEFGFKTELMDSRIAEFESLAKKAERQGKFIDFIKDNFKEVFWTTLAGLVLFIFLIIWWIRKRKKRKGNTVYSK
ncbi:MAG: hypothetical protein COB15_05460 [Flavobacteriales bacterium]|nr:MAG: hypothetical protein COB15_05460 [Flavobacteriales bacterium]